MRRYSTKHLIRSFRNLVSNVLNAQVDDSSLYTTFLKTPMHDLLQYTIFLKAQVHDSSLYIAFLEQLLDYIENARARD
jgi:hypothetical protein